MQSGTSYPRASLAAATLCGTLLLVATPGFASTEVSREPFVKFAYNNCPTDGSCGINFGVVPGGGKHRYEVTNVSCYVSITNSSARVLRWSLYAQKNGANVAQIFLRPTLLGTVPGSAITYDATEQTFFPAYGGTSLGIDMSRDASTAGAIETLQCTISGYDVRLQ